MSRYHNVRRKKKKGTSTQATPNPAGESAQPPRKPLHTMDEAYRKAVEETAGALYDKRGGKTIDASLKRSESVLALFDMETDKRIDSGATESKWQILPSSAMRWQQEQRRLEQRKVELEKECYACAREMVDNWLAAKGTEDQPTTEAPTSTESGAEKAGPMFVVSDDQPVPQAVEGGQAYADTSVTQGK